MGDELEDIAVYAASHYVAGRRDHPAGDRLDRGRAPGAAAEFEKEGKLLEAQRLRVRTEHDLEMLAETGVCAGIENYCRHLDGRAPGETPYTLLDYFPEDFLVVVDESHVAVPQLNGQYAGDKSRKDVLVEHGFRLPSAMDNRPLRFDEFLERVPQAVFVSATPGPYEQEHSTQIVEQVIRPTGLVDPAVEIVPTRGQIDDLRARIEATVGAGERVLVTTLDQEDGRGPDRLPGRGRGAGPVPALRHRHDRAHRDPPRAAPRRVRRARRHQPAARGARPARGGPRGDPRRGQGGVLALRVLAHPDDRPRGAQRRRDGGPLRRHHHRLHAHGDGGDRAAPETQLAYNPEHGIDPQTIPSAVKDILGRLRGGSGGAGGTAGRSTSAGRSRGRGAARTRRAREHGVPCWPRATRPRWPRRGADDALEAEMQAAAAELRFEEAALLRDELSELQRRRVPSRPVAAPAMADRLVVRGAREHNLKDVSLEMPRDKLIVFTGLSGSGKSSLAFDTIYAEGQRRYVETLSAYARQFLGQMDKPDVDFIEGLSPAISIDQKSASRNPRSTVGTVTEVYDYLRLLFARIGHPHCPTCGREVAARRPSRSSTRCSSSPRAPASSCSAPVVRGRKGEYSTLLDDLGQQGFSRVRVDGDPSSSPTASRLDLARYEQHTIEVVVDRLVLRDGIRQRLTESVETALRLGGGIGRGRGARRDGERGAELIFSQQLACAHCGISFDEPAPRDFSFNSPYGACPTCVGLGTRFEVDPELVVPDASLSLADGALAPWAGARTEYFTGLLGGAAELGEFSFDTPWKSLKAKDRKLLLYGTGSKPVQVRYRNRYGRMRSYEAIYEGLVPWLQRRHGEADSDWTREQIEAYMREVACPTCDGARLKPESLAVTVGGRNIAELCSLSIAEAVEAFATIELTEREHIIGERVIKEILERLQFLVDVGLDYLSLARSAGDAVGRRGAADPAREPDRQRARRRALRARRALDRAAPARQPAPDRHARAAAQPRQHRDRRRARRRDDPRRRPRRRHRPGRGRARRRGRPLRPGHRPGRAARPTRARSPATTSRASAPSRSRPGADRARASWSVRGAREHNLRDIDVAFPLGCLVAVTGVSGSGKSTLVNEILLKSLAHTVNRAKALPGATTRSRAPSSSTRSWPSTSSPSAARRARTRRPTPACSTRSASSSPRRPRPRCAATSRGGSPSTCSGGRCEACAGDGTIKIEMHFLPDVYVPCEVCEGARYNRETLEVLFRGKTIADVLDMSCEEALAFFAKQPPIARHLQTLVDVGPRLRPARPARADALGRRGPAGEARHRARRRPTGHTFYVLDEPTTGLHFEDVRRLLDVLQRLVDQGNTVVVIEHNLDVIKSADWIIDLGPEGGEPGRDGRRRGHARGGGQDGRQLHRARCSRRASLAGRQGPQGSRLDATPSPVTTGRALARPGRGSADREHPLERDPPRAVTTVIRLRTPPATSPSSTQARCGASMRDIVVHGQTERVEAHDRPVRVLVGEPLDEVDLGGRCRSPTRRGGGHAPDDDVGRPDEVRDLDDLVGALGVDHDDPVGVLGPERRHVLGAEPLVHRAVALPQEERRLLDLDVARARPPARGFQTAMSSAP